MIEQIWNRVKNLFGTGVATRVETGIVQMKLATGITNDRIKRVHNYGFMSRPLEGAKGYTLFIGGDTSRGIAVCVEDERYQIELQPGEVALIDDKGNLVHMTKNGVFVKSPFKVQVDTPNTIINATTTINGNTTINGALKSGAITAPSAGIGGIDFGTHVHPENDNGGPTGVPQ